MQIPGGGRREKREQRDLGQKVKSSRRDFIRNTRSKKANARCKGTTSGLEKEEKEKE